MKTFVFTDSDHNSRREEVPGINDGHHKAQGCRQGLAEENQLYACTLVSVEYVVHSLYRTTTIIVISIILVLLLHHPVLLLRPYYYLRV